MLELAIAYIAVIIVLSTLVTAMIEMLARLTPLRRWWLARALAKVLLQMRVCDTHREATSRARALLRDPLVNPGQQRHLDYVRGERVQKWLQQQIDDAINTEAGTKTGTEKERDAADLARLQGYKRAIDEEFNRWWQAFRDGQKRGYTALTRAIGFVLGVGLCVVFRIDAISLAHHLWRSPSDRAAWATLATDALEDDDSSAFTPTEPTDTTAEYYTALEDEIRFQICGAAGLWAELFESDERRLSRWKNCEQRVFPIMQQAREAKPDGMDSSWEDAAWAVDQRLTALSRLLQDTLADEAVSMDLLERARRAAEATRADSGSTGVWLTSTRALGLLKLPEDSPPTSIYDDELTFHLWALCRETCQRGQGFAPDCVMEARRCFTRDVPRPSSLIQAEPDPSTAPRIEQDGCVPCLDAVHGEIARILFDSQPDSWRERFQASFVAGSSDSTAQMAARWWAAILLEDLGEAAGPDDLLESLRREDTRQLIEQRFHDLQQAQAGAIEARQRKRYHDRYQVGFGGVERVRSRWARLAGYFIMAFLIALGAPFWFELLRYVNAARKMKEIPEVTGENP